jgi:hypothetical protein
MPREDIKEEDILTRSLLNDKGRYRQFAATIEFRSRSAVFSDASNRQIWKSLILRTAIPARRSKRPLSFKSSFL